MADAARLAQAIEDTLQFVSYAAHRGIALDKADIGNVVDAHRAGDAIAADLEKAFWTSAAAIAKAVAPVTIESLRASAAAPDDPGSAVRVARRYRLRTALTLLFLLLFQIYWLVGATVTADIKEVRGRLEKLQTEFQQSLTAPLLKANDPKKGEQAARDESFTARLWEARIVAATNFEILKNWNITKPLLLWARSPEPAAATSIPHQAIKTVQDREDIRVRVRKDDMFLWEFTTENVVELQTAQFVLTALLKYILPILYGALGACVYIVLSLAGDIKEQTYSVASNIRYQLRFYLGAITGFSIAWFTSDVKSAESPAVLQSLSPLALAFVAGYSVELLFSLLDRIVSAFSATPAAKAKPGP